MTQPKLLAALLSFSACIAAAVPAAPLTTIPTLDVPRYLGTWYEVAKFPNVFQKMCLGNTQAHYTSLPDGTVQVTNRCKKEGGALSDAVGAARQVGEANSPKLKVRFAPAWLSFLPMVWGTTG